MSIFVDEDSPMYELQWDKTTGLSKNLEKFNTLYYDLMLRNDVVTDKPEITKLTKEFLESLGKIIDLYQAKISEINAEKYAAVPSILTKEEFISKSVNILKQDSDFEEHFEYLPITKEELYDEKNLIKHMPEFTFGISTSVRFSFENFFVKRFVETDIGTFLFAYAYGDWEHPIFFFMYLSEEDPNKFFTYIPKNGNHWNLETRWAYDNEGYPRNERQYNKKAMLEELLAFFGGKEWK